MKKTLLFIAMFLLVVSAKAQDIRNAYTFDKMNNTVKFDITKISLFEQRAHFLYLLNYDERFVVTTSDKDGVFVIKPSKNSYNFNLEDTFYNFYKEEVATFTSMSKDEVGEMFNEWKSLLPNKLVASMMMDIYVKDRQNNLCANADPFCTDVGIYEFPAGVNAGNGESGPNYNCLSTRPNPAWYYMKMANPGGMTIYMYSTPSQDIDFCCWGPFEDPITPCPNGLTAAKVVSCSYAPAHTENCIIPSSAQTGQYYILVITNFSNNQCNITFSKTAGTGTTDCSIMPPLVENDGPYCVGETIHLTGNAQSGASYSWSGPGNWTATGQNVTRPNCTIAMAGTYTCTITLNGQTSSTDTHVEIYANPTANFNPPTAYAGIQTQFTSTSTTNPSGQAITSYLWNFGDNQTSTQQNPTHTYATPGSYTVTLTVACGENTCTSTKTQTLNVQSSMTATISGDNVICQNETLTLNANVSGGSGTFTYTWKKNGSTVGTNNPTLSLTMTEAGSYNFTCDISDGFTTQTPSINVIVNALPNAYAGADQTINFDNATTLEAGYIEGASYSWQPADSIVGSHSQRTVQTKQLKGNTIFTVTVTKNGCTAQDDVLVSVGAEMTATVSIDDSAICQGESTTVTATAIGGNPSSYTYSWEPAAEVEYPHAASSAVYPSLNTDHFTCTISDGHTTLVKTVNLTVYELPVANAGEDFPVHYENSATLTAAEVPGASYEWQPQNMIQNGDNMHQTVTTVPLTDETEFTLIVTRNGCSTEDKVVVFAGAHLQGTVQAQDNSICQYDGTTQLTAAAYGGNETYTYSWSSSKPGVFSNANQHITTFSEPAEAGEYILKCTISDGQNTIERSTTITVVEQPKADIWVVDANNFDEYPSVVAGSSLTLEASAVAGATYEWQPNNLIMNTSDNGRIAITYPLNDIGLYDFEVTVKTQTATHNYCTNSASLTAKVYSNVEASVHAEALEICERETMTLTATATGGTGFYNYTWEPAAYFENNVGQTVTTKALPGHVGMINFTCEVTDQFLDNAHNEDKAEVTVHDAPRINYDLMGEQLVEAGNEFYPFVYEYSIDSLSLTGYEIESIEWSIYSYYPTPNQLDPNTNESLWFCVPDPHPTDPRQPKKAYVYINEVGNAKLSCKITAACGYTEARIIIFTEGYEYDDVSVEEINYDDIITVYPNPTKGELYVSLGDIITSPVTVSIYSLSGMLMTQQTESGDMAHLSINGLSNGIYLVRITGKDFVVTKKVILNR